MDLLSMDKFIILEDDLVLAPDFYSYMQQTSVLLDRDPSVYGVSAYSHFSYNHTARDPSRLMRVHSLPAYGWMVKRSFLEEILPMWLPPFVVRKIASIALI
ncbi:Protein O-linked-mannose beta-1,2-N-acetylglucosaminyltransferase 1 [Halocaridina rubra]|uniref:Alpha-1,3-mannosyl-glycoprotein 2-beta-N-acetylglucosaminyltransferase n=1 Tax=Halocaridina rubra TaxID=373956 RepID=A0AAN8XHV4_HALRR